MVINNNIKNDDFNFSILNNIITPKEIKNLFVLPDILKKQIYNFRKTIKNIIKKKDKRKIIICGPCSVHDQFSIFDYATLLSELFKEIKKEIFLVLRVYLEKPRSSIGWKGFINDPYLNNTCNIEEGLKKSRQLLIKLATLEIPLATEILDLNVQNYLGDLFSWYAIGARNSESQLHREFVSSLNIPVGYKNSTDGSFISAINSIITSSKSHTFLGLNSLGNISILKSKGNNSTHIILRGGKSGPNYFNKNINDIFQYLQKINLNTTFLIDCSHDNANKNFKQQSTVFNEVLNYINNNFIIGLMLESHIYEGNQLFSTINKYRYGVSITDSCINWDITEKLILKLLKVIKKKN